MEIQRLLTSRRYSSAILKFIFVIFFFVFGFSLFVRNTQDDSSVPASANLVAPPQPESKFEIEPEPKVEIEPDREVNFVGKKFIAQYYEEEEIPYDNYCQIEMESRKLRVKEICSLYLQSDTSENGVQTPPASSDSVQTDRKIQFRAFMGKIKRLPDNFGNRILERSELSEPPNLENVEIEENRKMLLCAPHKVGSQTWRHFFERLKVRDGKNETEIFQPKIKFPDNISQFTKAYQVRHPFERILSAFRFIFEREAMRSNIQELKEEIIKNFPFMPSEMDAAHYYLNSSHMVAKNHFDIIPNFRQFSEYVVKSGADFGIKEYPVTSHWLPYYFSCSPCNPDFLPDIIIKMESILKDSLCYLDTIPSIDWEDLAKLHHVNQSPNGHSSNKELQKEYFSSLSEETMKRLYERYKPDFLLYGYNLDEFLPLAASSQ